MDEPGSPIALQPRQPNPKDPIAPTEPGMLHLSLIHRQLLPQRKILGKQSRSITRERQQDRRRQRRSITRLNPG